MQHTVLNYSPIEVGDCDGEVAIGVGSNGSTVGQAVGDIDITAGACVGWSLDIRPNSCASYTNSRCDDGVCLHIQSQAKGESKSEEDFGKHVDWMNGRE